MYILAVETSSDRASVSFLKETKIIASGSVSGKYSHNKRLFEMIENVLKSACMEQNNIDLFALGTGPGSFTGLRIGASAVKGMATALNKKIIPVPSIDAVALRAFEENPDYGGSDIGIAVEGMQKDFFYCIYTRLEREVVKKSEIVVHPYGFSSYIDGVTAGNVEEINVSFKKYIPEIWPEAQYVGRLAYIRRFTDSSDDSFEPHYHKEFKNVRV